MALISIKIKSSGDKKYDVEVDTDSTIGDLKTIISAVADVPAEAQRLIYSGKVLKDAETVAFYKIQQDHSIHLVKSSAAKKPAAATTNTSVGAGASSAAANSVPVPQSLAAGQGTANPLADLTGARYAGYTQLPSASMFGPDGGMGAFPDPEQLESVMQNPMFQQQMDALLSDPRMMDQIMDQSPQLRAMGPEARQMLRPMFREMMSNPESMRSMMNMARGAGAEGMGGAGAAAGFPAPGANPTVDGAASDGAAGSAGAANPWMDMMRGAGGAGGAGSANPFTGGFGGLGNLGGYGGLGGFGGEPAAAAPADTRPPEEKYESQLGQLNEMGFSNFEQNVAALRRSGGNVQGALEFLLSGGF